ncbi:MAG: DUF1232 domain-containing protein [Desulfoplanes sp.]
MNVKNTLNDFAKDTTVDPADRKNFFSKLVGIGLREIETLWHIVTHPKRAASVFSVADLCLITAAVAYVIMPVDLIPDFIPIIGLTDDATVVTFVLNTLGSRLEAYRQRFMG